ncbi:MAG: hypothetical protein KF802_14615 [Bdellovibrionaceae bacterium]|nr:hypothetical protein [Pseudobdellovibrionaceae bacterium]
MIDLILTYGKRSGWNDRELAEAIGMHPTLFNRWKHGHIPDFRKDENKASLKKAAKLTGLPSFADALSLALFEHDFEMPTPKFLPDGPSSKIHISPISESLEKKFRLVGMNSTGREAALDVAIEAMKACITHVMKEEWHEID